MQFNLQQAKTNLSKLIRAAENGEEVVIARGVKASGATGGGTDCVEK